MVEFENFRHSKIGIGKQLLNILVAGIISFVFLSVIFSFYSVNPVHIPNNGGNTDYKWPANSVWVNMTEGCSYGKFDGKGYNNLYVVDNPDILLVGSSHTEAKNVLQDESFSSLLSSKLSGNMTVYNMGISGHDIYKVCQYLEKSISQFDNTPKFVVIETDATNLSNSNVEAVINSTVEYTPSHNTGIVALLQKSPFLYLLYYQIERGLLNMLSDAKNDSAKQTSINSTVSPISAQIDLSQYEELFCYIQEIQDKCKTQIIIIYHPTGSLDEEGNISFIKDGSQQAFAYSAKEHNIIFIDMTDDFETMYFKEHHVAHGFANTKLCFGHLNRYGHAAVSERLYSTIIDLTE